MQCVSNGVTVEIGGVDQRSGGRQESEEAEMMEKLLHDREVLVNVLIYHWRTNMSGCGCGKGVLGKSHPDHVVQVYEAALRLRQT